jgi:hypothetical protein
MQPRPYGFFKQHGARRLFVSIALFIFIEGSFSFCSKTTCPAFADGAFDSWFPYQENQALLFTSAAEKDTITISSTYRSPEHKEYGRAVNCNAWTSVSSFVTATTPRFYINYNTYPDGNSLSVQLNDFRVSDATLSEEQITVTDNSAVGSLLSGVVIAGKSFGSVVQLQRDTTIIKSAGIYKMWFSKGMGLVGYEQYPTLEQWAKE